MKKNSETPVNSIERLHLRESFDKLQSSTFEGNQFLKKYADFNESSYSTVAQLLLEGAALRDEAVSSWCKNCQKLITKEMPIGMQVGYALDEAQNTVFGKSLNEELKFLTYYSEQDLKDAIGNGVLQESIDISPRLRSLHESLTKTNTVAAINSPTHISFHPISYIHESLGKQYFMLEGKTLCFDSEKIYEAEAPTSEFTQVNGAIQELPFDYKNNIFSISMLPGTVNITKKGKVTINGQEVSSKEFVGAISSAISECLDEQKKRYNARMADNICLVMENYDKLCELDNIDTCLNKATNESVSFIKHTNSYYIFENLSSGTSLQEHLTINESLKYMKEHTGIDLFERHKSIVMNEQRDIAKIREMLKEQEDVELELKKALKICEDELAILNMDAPNRFDVEGDIRRINEELEVCQQYIKSYKEILSSAN